MHGSHVTGSCPVLTAPPITFWYFLYCLLHEVGVAVALLKLLLAVEVDGVVIVSWRHVAAVAVLFWTRRRPIWSPTPKTINLGLIYRSCKTSLEQRVTHAPQKKLDKNFKTMKPVSRQSMSQMGVSVEAFSTPKREGRRRDERWTAQWSQ